MRNRDRRAKAPTEILASGFVMNPDREVTLFDVAMSGIASATGSLEDPVETWESVNWLRKQGNPLPLPIWWAAAAWPERVHDLILPAPPGKTARAGTEAALAAACLAAAGLMESAEAQQFQDWNGRLAASTADGVATRVVQDIGELLMMTNPEGLQEMVMKIKSMNTEVRVGGTPPQFSEQYLLVVARLAEGLRYVSAGISRAFNLIRDELAEVNAPNRPLTHLDIPSDLRKRISAELHIGYVQASTKIALPADC
ncbi:hypothetical protein [Mycobacteroides abscessus]|uniref:hypothetical protein n=1 Tax=Mycobacteroides abscessus TaxID=36809 RepID=UPI000C25F431|nr:hypothetical protein [Mycobacteroides abscessus]